MSCWRIGEISMVRPTAPSTVATAPGGESASSPQPRWCRGQRWVYVALPVPLHAGAALPAWQRFVAEVEASLAQESFS